MWRERGLHSQGPIGVAAGADVARASQPDPGRARGPGRRRTAGGEAAPPRRGVTVAGEPTAPGPEPAEPPNRRSGGRRISEISLVLQPLVHDKSVCIGIKTSCFA